MVLRTFVDRHGIEMQGLVKIDESADVADRIIFSLSSFDSPQPIIIGKNCQIAPGTIISSGAVLGDNCEIGNNSIIGANAIIGRDTRIGHGTTICDGVEIGTGNIIDHHVVIMGQAKIGNRNTIASFVTIGADPQHPKIRHAVRPLRIGNENVIREYVSIHSPAEYFTEVGNRCYIMAYSCINHDDVIGDNVTISNNCHLAGYVEIKRNANLGMGCVVHQHSVIGAGVMLGMGSIVTKDVPPFVTFYAGEIHKLNRFGMTRMGYTDEQIDELAAWYAADKETPLNERMRPDQTRWWDEDLAAFLYRSRRSVCRLTNL